MNFLLRTDANKEIGSGHLMRCLALGQLLQDVGHKVHFVTKTTNEYLLKRLKDEKFDVYGIDENIKLPDDVKITVNIGRSISSKWIITDGYEFTTEYQKIIKDAGFKLMCIDDISAFHFVSDIVLNQNLNSENIFKYSCEPYTKLLLGIKFVLLRREYRDIMDFDRKIVDECKNVLVTFGGGDTENFIIKIIKSLNFINVLSLNVRILIGSNNLDSDRVNDLINKSTHKIELLKTQENLIPLIQWCDVAISAAGSTVWELVFLKTPIILIPIADNQIPISEELKKREAVIVLGKEDDISVYSEVIKKFLLNSHDRKYCSVNISGLIKTESNVLTDFLC